MRVVAFDTETVCFRPGCMAPPLVCVSWQVSTDGNRGQPCLGHVKDPETLRVVEAWLRSDVLFVGHHVVYDFAVLCAQWPHLVPLVFAAYDADRVTDTKLRQQLLDIAAGCFRGRQVEFSRDVTKADGTVEVVKGARWIQYNYDLDAIYHRATGGRLEKDEWRMRYGEFLDVPLEQWPEGAREYPKKDAEATLDVYLMQEKHADYLEDQFRQARGAWALHLTQTWGLRTHGPSVARLRAETEAALAAIEGGLVEVGLVRQDGTRDTKKAQARMVAVCKPAGRAVRLTDGGEDKLKDYLVGQDFARRGCAAVGGASPSKAAEAGFAAPSGDVYEYVASVGGISLDSDACEASQDDLLEDYAELSTLKKVLSNDTKMLEAGVDAPVHTSYGMAASGRTTSSKPNVQNPKRSGDVHRNGKVKYTLPDVRECYMPRPGTVYAQADFDQMELHCIGQVCLTLFGESKMAEAINSGVDPHVDMACRILGGIPYAEGMKRRKDKADKVFDNARQTSKVCNFGFPGGLGAETLCFYARKNYQVSLGETHEAEIKRAKELKQVWLEQWPEMRKFFAYTADLIDADAGVGAMEQLFVKRWRGGCFYCAACNSWYQGLASDAAKRALYLVVRACYTEPDSVLYGSRPVLFVHDEIVMEVADDAKAHDKAVEMARLMVQGANEFIPDVPAKASPILATRWSKKMEPRYSADGRLVPWSPEEK